MQEEQLEEHHRIHAGDLRVIYNVKEILVFEVDDVIWDFYDVATVEGVSAGAAALRERHGAQVAQDVLDELRELGLVIPQRSQPEPKPVQPVQAKPRLKGVTLNVMHGCNLACTYCFAKQGDYGLGKKRMTEETAAKAIDWAEQHRQEGSRLLVGFFGGEPLLNMPTIRSAVEHARQRGAEHEHEVGFHVTTNGTLLSEDNVQYLADNQIHVQVSLDGTPDINDRYRIYRSGKGSHAQVVAGAKRLKDATRRLTLRGTISAAKPEFGESVRHMIEDIGATRVAFEPAELEGEEGIDADELVARIKAEWSRLAADFEEHARAGELKPYANLIKIMQAIHDRRKVVYGCQAGHSNVAVDPDGDIYPCHRFVGEQDWKIGNIHTGELREQVTERFVANTVDSKEPCRSCWARYTCGGRCAHEAKQATGDISAPDPRLCELVKHMTELGLVLYAKLKPIERQVLASRLFDGGPAKPDSNAAPGC